MTFNWNDEKNAILKQTRNISFEEIVIAIEEGCVVDIVKHPNTDRFPNQLVYLVEYRQHVWAVPHVVDEDAGEVFLKTIYPTRKFTRQYLGRREE
jgi:uncharacterized DUF497 family protein